MGVKAFDKANPSTKQLEIYNKFDGGINTELADSVLGDNEFREIINFDMDAAGCLKKRPGLYRLQGAPLPDDVHRTIDELIKERLRYAIQHFEICGGFDEWHNPKPAHIKDLKILDVYVFFDGAHYSFNYLTNKGLVTLVLTELMQLPPDISDPDIPFVDGRPAWMRYVQFYPYGNGDVTQYTSYRASISAYNDTWILKVSSTSPLTHPADANKHQVTFYNWNPVTDKDVFNPDGKKGIYPRWYQAAETQDEAISTTKVNERLQGTLSSEVNWTDLTNQVINGQYKFHLATDITYNMPDYENYDMKVYLKSNDEGAYLEIWRKQKTPFPIKWDEDRHKTTVPLKHQNGDFIYDHEIYCVVYRGYQTFWVYLNNAVNYKSSDNPLAWKSDNFNSTLSWFKVKVPGSGACVTEYLSFPHQLPFTSTSGFPTTSTTATTFGKDSPAASERSYYKVELAEGVTDTIANTLCFNELGIALNTSYHCAKPRYADWTPNVINFFSAWNTAKYPANLWPSNISWATSTDLLNKSKVVLEQGTVSSKYKYISKFTVVDYGSIMTANPTNSNIMGGILLYPFVDSKPDRTSYRYLSSGAVSGFLVKQQGSPTISAESGNEQVLLTQFSKGTKCEGSLADASGKPWLLQNITKNNFLGLGSTIVTGSYTDTTTKTTKTFGLACGYYEGNTFTFETPAYDNILNLYRKHGYNTENEKYFLGTELFGQEAIEKMIAIFSTQVIVGVNLKAEWQVRFNDKSVDTRLAANELVYFFDAVLDPNPRFRMMGSAQYLPDVSSETGYSLGLDKAEIQWKKKDTQGIESWQTLFVLDESVEPLWHSDYLTWQGIINTFKLVFYYEYLGVGESSKVLSYEQLYQTKPTLADLNSIWYNMALFDNKSKDTLPDIYDKEKYIAISNELVEYPRGDLQQRKIQLFGLQPVNDLILQPGQNQRFQLFYQGSSMKDVKALKIAITSMTIADYTAMINSEDFSTTGYKGEGSKKEPVKGPIWKSWDETFVGKESFDQDPYTTDWDDPENPNFKWVSDDSGSSKKVYWGKRAIFNLSIPSTTQPYMVLVQVCEFKQEKITINENGQDVEKTVDIPDLATIQETRIQMQPTTSYRQKINTKALFDEFVSTSRAVNFATSLVSYGEGNKLFFSDNAVPTYFPLSSIMQMKTPEAIQHCTIFQNKLIVSSNNAKFYVGGSSFDSSTDPYYIREIASDTGLLAPKSEVPLGNFLYFLDNGGVKILKNLYGTADKEFAFENIDTKITQLVPRTGLSTNAVGVAYKNKYYLNFPDYKFMLVYNPFYKAWVVYEGEHIRFSSMFVKDDVLYAVGLDNFNIYRFDDTVYVDNWNEYEDGFQDVESVDGSWARVQKGTLIKCSLRTKNYDQSYLPHRKKYDWALIGATTHCSEDWGPLYPTEEGFMNNNASNSGPGVDAQRSRKAVNAIVPYLFVDDNLINYQYQSVETDDEKAIWHYVPEQGNDEDLLWMPEPFYPKQDSVLRYTAVVANDEATYGSRLGENANSYYNIPIQRKGNTISFGLVHKDYTGITLDAIVVRFSLAKIRKNRGRQS